MQSAHAISCQLWPVWINHISPHDLTNDTIFGKNILNIKCGFLSSLQLCLKHCHSKEHWVIHDHQIKLVFIWGIHYTCQTLMKLASSWHFFLKYSNINFSRKSVQCEPSCSTWTGWWTDEQTRTFSYYSRLIKCI
jgi:hypothetical protein